MNLALCWNFIECLSILQCFIQCLGILRVNVKIHSFEMDGTMDVWDWAPPGWHWEVPPSGVRRLVRNEGTIVDPELLWWRSRGPRRVQRVPAPEELVRRRVRAEDEHVRRYMVALDVFPSNTWQHLQGSHISYDPVWVPSLWVFTARGMFPAVRRPF